MINIATLKNKIPEVLAYARLVSIRNGHTRKYAKHIVALVIKQIMQFTDRELAEFLSKNEIGKILGYKSHFNYTIFSKVRKNAWKIVKELYDFLVYQKMKGKQVRLMAQDSTDIPAYSKGDRDARFGHKTPSKKEQIANKSKKKSFVFGYKLHAVADAEEEIPLSVEIAPANRHDKTFFNPLYNDVKENFTISPYAKFISDSALDSTEVYEKLHDDNIKAVIATNGRRFRKSQIPKDPDYGKRWSIERVFSRLKELFGLAKNRFIGIKKVVVHAYACLIAYLLRYA